MGTCLQDVSNNTATLAGGSVYAFIIPLTSLNDATMLEESLLDNNFVLLEDGIAGLATTAATMGAYPLWVGIGCTEVVVRSGSAIHAGPGQGNAAVRFCFAQGAV